MALESAWLNRNGTGSFWDREEWELGGGPDVGGGGKLVELRVFGVAKGAQSTLKREYRIQLSERLVTWSTSPGVYGEGGTSGSALGGAPFSWAGCGVRFLTFDIKIDGGSTRVMADAGRFLDEDRIGDLGATGAPFLDGSNLKPFLAGGLAGRESGGLEFFWQGLKLVFRLFDRVLDLISPGFRVVEGVNHLFEREREL